MVTIRVYAESFDVFNLFKHPPLMGFRPERMVSFGCSFTQIVASCSSLAKAKLPPGTLQPGSSELNFRP
jgi:hypothetical protein